MFNLIIPLYIWFSFARIRLKKIKKFQMEVGVSGLNLEAAATNVREELLLGSGTPGLGLLLQ
jgi:hypothetical protein